MNIVMHKKVKDLTGKVFNRLTVIKYIGIYQNQAYWLCKCTCGNMHKSISSSLIQGRTVSCGCKRFVDKKLKHKGKSGKGKGPINNYYCKYKYCAKHRKISFNLSLYDFEKLILEKCYYCGETPIKSVYYPVLLVNGIDRKDNNKGYEKDNCVTCCKQCNQAKSNLTIDEFYKWIKKVSNHNAV